MVKPKCTLILKVSHSIVFFVLLCGVCVCRYSSLVSSRASPIKTTSRERYISLMTQNSLQVHTTCETLRVCTVLKSACAAFLISALVEVLGETI